MGLKSWITQRLPGVSMEQQLLLQHGTATYGGGRTYEGEELYTGAIKGR